MKPYMYLFFILLSLNSYSQQSFEVGEKLKYDVYYKVAFVWMDAAYVNLDVDETTYQSNKYYKFNATASSKPSYDWIFRVRDYFTSVSSKDELFPTRFHRNTSEGSYRVNIQYDFDYDTKAIYSLGQKNKNKSFKDTVPIKEPVRDILSAAYHVRNMNISKLKEGDIVPIKSVIDNDIYNTDVLYMGVEWVKHKNKKKYLAYKFRSKGLEGSMFDKDDFITVWISKDKHKVPIKIEAGIVVGKVLVYLNSADIPNEHPNSILKEF